MYKFQDESFAFLKDGNYPIDHNSDKGAEMAVDYHGIMSAVKL